MPTKPVEQRGVIGNSQSYNSPSDQYAIRKAVRERWPITSELRERVVDELLTTLNSPNLDCSLRLTAARTVAQIDALNLKEKELQIRREPKHIVHTNMSTEELVARVKELQGDLGLTFPEKAAEFLLPKGEP